MAGKDDVFANGCGGVSEVYQKRSISVKNSLL
jgi:hypothetical protein